MCCGTEIVFNTYNELENWHEKIGHNSLAICAWTEEGVVENMLGTN